MKKKRKLKKGAFLLALVLILGIAGITVYFTYDLFLTDNSPQEQ